MTKKKYIKELEKIFENKKKIKEGNELSYEAHVFCDSFEDDYKKGEGEQANSWDQTFRGKDLKKILTDVASFVNAPSIKDLEYQGDVNEYPDMTELWYGYMGDENNSEASKQDLELFKKGKKQLWSIQCHINVSQVGKSKVSEDDLKKVGIKV